MRERQNPQPISERKVATANSATRPELVRRRYVPDNATARFIEEANALVTRYGHTKFDPSLERAGRII